MTNTIEFDANKHSIEAVTVFYGSYRAEVTRKIAAQLDDGQNTIEVKNLPSSIDENSIRVDGIGNAIIFDVVYHPPSNTESQEQQEKLRDLRARKNKISAHASILKHQSDVLKDYSKTMNGKDTDVKQLETFLDFYSAKKANINDEQSKLADEIAKIDAEIDEKSKELFADEDSIRKRGVRISIVVLASGAGEAEVSLTYMVSGASWTPQYDLRASIAADEKSKSSVTLSYRASILQTSGEDWSDVKLSLSTATPLQGVKIPTLSAVWINEKRPAPVVYEAVEGYARPRWRSVRASSPARRTWSPSPTYEHRRRSRSRSRSRSPRPQHAVIGVGGSHPPPGIVVQPSMAPPPPPQFMPSVESKAVQGTVSTSFTIPGLSSIPSESTTLADQKKHTVTIAELRFDAVELDWITVPRVRPIAFLRCRVQNTSEYVLLPGDANVFLNGSFVAKSSIPNVSAQDKFICSLGIDPAVRVTYHPQSKKTKHTGSLLSTKTSTTIFEQIITIKNTRRARLPRLHVSEQIPVSSNAKIKVNVLEPKALATLRTAGGGKDGAVLKDGIKVRWVKASNGESTVIDDGDGDDELDAEKARGLFEWVCDAGPSSTVNVTLSWEVVAPVGLEWI